MLSRDGSEILTAHSALGRRELRVRGCVVSPAPMSTTRIRARGTASSSRAEDTSATLAEFRLARGRQLDEIERIRRTGRRIVRALDPLLAGHPTRRGRRPRRSSATSCRSGSPTPSGKPYAGNSLDNTIRVGQLVETEWVLLSMHVQQVANGFGYGRAELWAEDGTLLGEVSQSAVLRSALADPRNRPPRDQLIRIAAGRYPAAGGRRPSSASSGWL